MAGFTWKDGATSPIIIRGKTLEAASWGPPPGDASTIVLLHEGLGCLSLWRDFPKKLAKATGFGVFAWSRAGYGQSDPADLPLPLDYMTREALDCLPEVLETIGFERGILLGHSDGASIAAIYAGSVEDFRVRGLVLMAPHFFTEPEGLASIAAAKTAFETGDLRAKLARHHRDVDHSFRGWNDAWLNPKFKEWNIAETIDYLRIPVLAIQGESDQYGSIAQIDEIETRIYSPVDVVILKNCGHAPQTEQPDATLAAIADFVSRLERIESAVVEPR